MRPVTGYCRFVLIRRRLVLAVAALVAASCSQADLAPEQVSDRLLVTGDDGSVTIVDGNGMTFEELAGPGGGGSPVQATSAPDGSAVVWTSGASTQLWVDGDVITIEPDFAPFFYLWAPDGSRILALGNDPVQPSVRAALIGRDGSVEVVVIDRPIYAQWLDETQGLDDYLESMRRWSREMAEISGQADWQYAEGFRRHSHVGFSAEDGDPLSEILGELVHKPE